ncbi:MAG: hypothetical protein ACI8Q1_003372 [Parvicella sp.]|jgi:hypothetical protein
MTRFFRHIRKKLMEKKKTRSYMLYAFGEIFLVMIGILLALQVNNWNEERKLQKRETKLLKEMRSDLMDQKDDLLFNIEHHQGSERSCRIIRQALLNNMPFHDSLKVHFQQAYNFTILENRQNAYTALLSEGIELINNDSLRFDITEYYELGVPYQLEIQDATVDFMKSASERHLSLFKNMNWSEPLEPWDYEGLKENRSYISWLSFMVGNKHFEASTFQRLLDKNIVLTQKIIEELGDQGD